ncbi:two component transcriptional regulator, LytTR family [Pilibacter termitis]|uniref:Two component transcriptional regulator, LytTR family n=1 Tax=Pilibacter termitis TaxID=263852 RepID=A0A1T4RHF1_9ENTE|nr:LytTR family DNA-binding domain-containing protein [Pilibacter termitis]SKA15363.1 two component transcriptional regulator, LytTR family [Pilibacter termitis]
MKIAYCDDEPLCLTLFQEKLTAITRTLEVPCTLTTYTSGGQCLYEDMEFDCLFLDVEMPELDGFQVATEYLSRHSKTKIIFLTTHGELAPSSFHYGAYRYLTKPVSDFFLEEAIASIYEEWLKSVITIEHEKGVCRTKLQDIFAIETSERKTIVHLQNETLTTTKSMKEWAEFLEEFPEFFMCNKGILINIKHVSRLENLQVYFDNDRLSLPVAIKKMVQVKRLMKRLGGS